MSKGLRNLKIHGLEQRPLKVFVPSFGRMAKMGFFTLSKTVHSSLSNSFIIMTQLFEIFLGYDIIFSFSEQLFMFLLS